jgi:hypothetical protein
VTAGSETSLFFLGAYKLGGTAVIPPLAHPGFSNQPVADRPIADRSEEAMRLMGGKPVSGETIREPL